MMVVKENEIMLESTLNTHRVLPGQVWYYLHPKLNKRTIGTDSDLKLYVQSTRSIINRPVLVLSVNKVHNTDTALVAPITHQALMPGLFINISEYTDSFDDISDLSSSRYGKLALLELNTINIRYLKRYLCTLSDENMRDIWNSIDYYQGRCLIKPAILVEHEKNTELLQSEKTMDMLTNDTNIEVLNNINITNTNNIEAINSELEKYNTEGDIIEANTEEQKPSINDSDKGKYIEYLRFYSLNARKPNQVMLNKKIKEILTTPSLEYCKKYNISDSAFYKSYLNRLVKNPFYYHKILPEYDIPQTYIYTLAKYLVVNKCDIFTLPKNIIEVIQKLSEKSFETLLKKLNADDIDTNLEYFKFIYNK